ncbi:hypothetical protein CEXT_237161 [Caerostris extrusa]|uniref:Secreted protein n=1 Tax=Caerostris extrusa TaxID=172846 RepID=A0AAV4U113_CAEEX|nr:hypothetical protein CEXT_237161 [Caerostris extrusa]
MDASYFLFFGLFFGACRLSFFSRDQKVSLFARSQLKRVMRHKNETGFGTHDEDKRKTGSRKWVSESGLENGVDLITSGFPFWRKSHATIFFF